MADPLPVEVRRLIAGPLESIEHVELLLLLARSAPREWTAAEASAEARLDPAFSEHRLRDLVRAQLLVEAREHPGAPPRFAFAPTHASSRRDVALLEEMYNTRPVTLVRAVYNRRAVVAQTFADAFRVRAEDQ